MDKIWLKADRPSRRMASVNCLRHFPDSGDVNVAAAKRVPHVRCKRMQAQNTTAMAIVHDKG
jgi:hypothetical protein